MISHLYAIADAGGNIYPGTFSTLARTAMITHVGNPSFCAVALDGRPYSPLYSERIEEWKLNPVIWEPYAAKGDHVVYCRIETNETVVVTRKAVS